MTTRELFGSRRFHHGPEGIEATRVFLCDWDAAFGATVPRHNDSWRHTDDSRIKASDSRPLWVHDVRRHPEGASSSSGSYEGATHCRVTVDYRSWPLDLTAATNWIVESRHSCMTIDVGPGISFSTSGEKIPQRSVKNVPIVEYMVTGEEALGDGFGAWSAAWDVPAVKFLGTVCIEGFSLSNMWPAKDRNSKVGHLLFHSQAVTRPYFRPGSPGTGPEPRLYRRFNRSIMWRVVTEAAGAGREIVGGHNSLWDPSTGHYDMVTPRLYEFAQWRVALANDWDVPVPRSILVALGDL